MSESLRAPIGHINLFNPGLAPAKKSFSARSLVLWGTVAAVSMIGVAWWAIVERENVAKQLADQEARRTADAGRAEAEVPTLQQISALEQAVHAKEALLETRKRQRDTLKQGVAADGGGPSQTLRLVATSIPAEVWVTDLNAHADRLEISGRTINPAELAAWMSRLGESNYFAAKPISRLQLDNVSAGTQRAASPVVYAFSATAQLAKPFADDGGRAP